MKPAQIAFGQKIRRIRESRKLTQEQVAEVVNISLKHMGHIERGIANPTFKTLLGLAKALETPLPDLIDYGDFRLTDRELRDSVKRSMAEMNTDQLRAVKMFCEIINQ